MKELSIEEKAKRFDESLEKARRYYDEYKTRDNILYVEDMEDMFPELKDSEDERMRAMAIKAVHAPEAQSCIKSWGINPDDVIAWLEKQSEQPKKNDVCNNCDQQGSCISPCPMKLIEKQGEQKPVENSGKKSEDVIEEKDMTEYNKGFECGKQRVLKYPEDYNLCKKQKWSEEDERILKEMIKIFGLEKFEGYNIGENNEDALKFLNSLKEIYTWKPSAVQMHYLSWIANIKLGDSLVDREVSKHLNGLLEDLKKLRKE